MMFDGPEPTLRLPAAALTRLREALVTDTAERLAYVTLQQTPQGTYLWADWHPLTDEEHRVSTPMRCRAAPAVERQVLGTCLAAGHALVLHSHPCAETAEFSQLDHDLMQRYHDWLTALYPERDLLFGVVTPDDLLIARQTADDTVPVAVDVVGDWTLDNPVGDDTDIDTASATTPAVETERFDRQLRAFTTAGQSRLAATHVVIVGYGGLGSFVVEECARVGIGQVTLIDPDEIDRSNLPRLLGATDDDVGRPKVAYAHDQVIRGNPDCDVTTVAAPVEEAADHLHQADVILAGVDRISTRLWLNEWAVAHLTPYIDAASRIQLAEEEAEADHAPDAPASDEPSKRITTMDGFVQTIVPGTTACFTCLERGNPQTANRERLTAEQLDAHKRHGYIADTELAPAPAVVHLNGVVASLAVSTLVKGVTGVAGPPSFLRYDALAASATPFETPPVADCPVCGDPGILGQGCHGREPTQLEIETVTEFDLDAALQAQPDYPGPVEDASDDLPAAVTAFFEQT